MGMQIFTESGQFNPADWGLKAGDMLQVVVVGGGGGGGAGRSYNASQKGMNGGDGGKNGEAEGTQYGGGAGGGYGAGGGGGQSYRVSGASLVGGGGGAGGDIVFATYKITSVSPITVTVGTAGKGGIAGYPTATQATKGGDSSFDNIIASGGNPGGSPDGGDNLGGTSDFAPGGHGSVVQSNNIYTGVGGGGGGGYIIGMPLYGGRGSDGATEPLPGLFNGGVGGGLQSGWPSANSGGSPSGYPGGPGHGVVVVCW